MTVSLKLGWQVDHELSGADPGFLKGGAKVYSEVGQEKKR